MIIDKHIDKDNWYEIKDILPQITEIKSLNLSDMGLTEFPKMSHITIKGNFVCWNNQIKSFNGCPQINGIFSCSNNRITSFKDIPVINGSFYCAANQITSFNGCPNINGNFYCTSNQLTSFKNCPNVGGIFLSDIQAFNIIYHYSKKKKISLLESQVELYNQQNEEILAYIDKFPDLVAYHRIKELKKIL